MVTTQAMAISSATPQRTLLKRSAEPTPIMAELTTWVVLTGRRQTQPVVKAKGGSKRKGGKHIGFQ